jgi:two-component system sensor histidine kinase TctE
VIQVGETLHKRNRLVGEIVFAELVPTLLIALVAIALTWFGVARGLVPLEHLRSELRSRAPRDLRPLAAAATPVEIAPLVNAFNGLLNDLRESSMMQQRFLANAAHQLRTPLAGLQMHLELLLRRELPGDVRIEIERMHGAPPPPRQSTRTGEGRVPGSTSGARDRRSADDRRRSEEDRRLGRSIGYRSGSMASLIRGDPLLLPELVDNLIDNALRYTPPGGSVTVHTGCDAETPYLSVEDTGPGIPAAERRKVRERFYRMAGTPGDGSGLGLAIAQEVFDRHAGVLEINSRDEHGGTASRSFRVDWRTKPEHPAVCQTNHLQGAHATETVVLLLHP